MINKILEAVEQDYLKKDIPQFAVGDTVDVHTRIIEGEKERIQVFSGTVIMKKGRGINETFTVRRIVNNEGVERIRSEEHTSELQSRLHLVCRLLLEKKNRQKK